MPSQCTDIWVFGVAFNVFRVAGWNVVGKEDVKKSVFSYGDYIIYFGDGG